MPTLALFLTNTLFLTIPLSVTLTQTQSVLGVSPLGVIVCYSSRAKMDECELLRKAMKIMFDKTENKCL